MLRVLIVEDSQDDALLLERELLRGGFRTQCERVETPQQMREALERRGPWDVVISDYRLPRFGALEALKLFESGGESGDSGRGDAPFIVVSGKVGEEAAVEVIKAGAYDFLSKGNLGAMGYITGGTMPLLVPTVERGLREAQQRKRSRRAQGELRRREAVLEAVRFAAERFLGETRGWEHDVGAVLARLGEAAEVSRVYIFENYYYEREGEREGSQEGEHQSVQLRATQRYEWVAAGITAQIDNPLLKAFPYREAGFERWEEKLGGGQIVYGNTRTFPKSEQAEMSTEEILSIVVVPIFVEGVWWGFIGFDDCLREREWSAAEIDALKAAASTLGAAIRRKRVEEALRESKERYSLVVEGSYDGIFDWDITNNELYWNERIYEMLGLSREEVTPSYELFEELLHPQDRKRVVEALRAHLYRGEPYSEEFRLRHESGRYIYCVGRGRAQREEGGEAVRMAGVLTDVTARKQAEERLRSSEAELRAVFEAMTDLIFVFDAEGRYLKVAPSNPSLLYRPAEQLLGKTLHEVLPAPQADGFLASIRHALETQQSVNYEYDLQIGGRQRWFEATISPMMEDSVVAVARDVTERKENEEALKESERLYRAVIEEVTENICLVDVASARIVGSNPSFRNTLGYSEEELEAMTLYEIVAHTRESVERNIRHTLQEGRSMVGQREYRRKDGTLLEVEASASVIVRDGRQTLCVVAHDVTERARMQRLLEERVATLSAIAANLTFDLSAEDTLDILAQSVVKASTAVACGVVLVDTGDDTLHLFGSYGLPEGYTAGLQKAYRSGAPSPSLMAFRTHEPVLVRSLRRYLLEEPLYAPIHPFVHEVPWDIVYSLPLVSRYRTVGAIFFCYLPDQEPGEEEKVFLKAVADQAAVAIENARLFAEVRGKAALEERQRLARELHDSVSQALYGIALGAKTARTLIQRDPPQALTPLDYVLSLAQAGLAEMRALIFELRPESLESEGLVAALEKQAAALRARYELEVEASLCEEPAGAGATLEVKEALYRIAQEALHNVVKHARAGRVLIEMRCTKERVELEITDDGIGFDPEGDYPGHLGLRSMRERIERLGGTLEVESAVGEGTTIHALMPVRVASVDPT